MAVGRLEGQVAVITGGTGALGRGVVGEFLREGAIVHVPWVSRDEANELAGEMAVHGSSLHLHPADLTDPVSVEAFFLQAARSSGPPRILVNGAGGFSMATVEETTPESWRRMMTLNGETAFLCARAAVPGMSKLRSGRIINVAAVPAVDRGAARMSAYAASKAAVLSLTHSLSKELRPRGITVNAVVPTTIDTPANRESMPDADRSTWLDPREIGRVMVFLAGEEAAIVTGAALTLGRG